MYFHIFAKKRCKYCSKATKLLEEKDLSYVITYCDKAPEALDEMKTLCEWKTVPLVFEIVGAEDSFIGGCAELEGYLDGSQEEEGRGEGTDDISEDQVYIAEDDGVRQSSA